MTAGRPGKAGDVATRESPRRSGAATIYDIAALAGVNASTVSRALNRPGRVNRDTEARIRAAAEELNYQANPVARALLTGKSYTLGLMVGDITNPVIFQIVRGAEHEAAENGYILVIAESEESSLRESRVIERLAPSIDGLVLATTRQDDAEIKRLVSRVPVVLVNRRVRGVPAVLPRLEPGVDAAVGELARLGHEELLFVGGPNSAWMSPRRQQALASACERLGMRLRALGPCEPTIDGGRAIFPDVLASGATAVATYNDVMAIGLLKAAKASGVDIPGRLSVFGFDNIFGSDFTAPALSTIESPLPDLGRRAVRQLLGLRLDSRTLQTSFIDRESIGPPPAR